MIYEKALAEVAERCREWFKRTTSEQMKDKIAQKNVYVTKKKKNKVLTEPQMPLIV
jgi:hypothetical protein